MPSATAQGRPDRRAHLKHDLHDISARSILMIAFIMLALAISIHLAVWGEMNYYHDHPAQVMYSASPLAKVPRNAPGPGLQVDPASELEQFRGSEESLLNSYGWVNRASGTVRIPIDQARRVWLKEYAANGGRVPVLRSAPPAGSSEEPGMHSEGVYPK